ncbi:unnamed protein product, partial [Arabidopsis halleri]
MQYSSVSDYPIMRPQTRRRVRWFKMGPTSSYSAGPKPYEGKLTRGKAFQRAWDARSA